MTPKLMEMDEVVKMIHLNTIVPQDDIKRQTLLVGAILISSLLVFLIDASFGTFLIDASFGTKSLCKHAYAVCLVNCH